MSWQILEGDALDRLRELPAESVQTVITSPPYWGLRSYGTEPRVWGGDPAHEHEWKDRRYYVEGGGGAGSSAEAFSEPGEGNAERIKKARWREDAVCECGAWSGNLGLEPTPDEYVANLVAVFREVRRVLRDDGTVWLNLGDSYFASSATGNTFTGGKHADIAPVEQLAAREQRNAQLKAAADCGLKPKDLVGIPWRVAFALQADGWWLRSDIIWAKPNPMPESVTDRPTRSHEYIFLLTKSARYFYDADAVREEAIHAGETRSLGPKSLSRGQATGMGVEASGNGLADSMIVAAGRNKRSVWTVTTQPYAEAHFATFPPKLIEPCVLAGSPPKCCGECGAPWERVTEKEWTGWQEGRGGLGEGPSRESHGLGAVNREGYPTGVSYKTTGWRSTCPHDDDSGRSTVLDPFAGSGTTGLVALRHDRSFVGIELSPAYCELARNRIRDDAPLFNWSLEA